VENVLPASKLAAETLQNRKKRCPEASVRLFFLILLARIKYSCKFAPFDYDLKAKSENNDLWEPTK
jgi:hypothetical protein